MSVKIHVLSIRIYIQETVNERVPDMLLLFTKLDQLKNLAPQYTIRYIKLYIHFISKNKS